MNKICYLGQFPEHQLPFSRLETYKKNIDKQGDGYSNKMFQRYFEGYPLDTPIAPFSIRELKLLSLVSYLTSKTELVILDEPTWGLDRCGQRMIWDLICEFTKDHRVSLLIISHDLSIVKPLKTKLLWMSNRQLRYYEGIRELIESLEGEGQFIEYPSSIDEYSRSDETFAE
jgi:ABC-type multidrug transport system ATPase subunit